MSESFPRPWLINPTTDGSTLTGQLRIEIVQCDDDVNLVAGPSRYTTPHRQTAWRDPDDLAVAVASKRRREQAAGRRR